LEKHWTIAIYQAFFAFIHLGTVVSEDRFYADLSQPSELAKTGFSSAAILLGDALVASPAPVSVCFPC
jgi:hypothetical protein